MIKKFLYLLAFTFCNIIYAQTEAIHNIPEFTFESGKKLQNMKVGYVTHGTLNANKSNAILVTHGTSGNRLGYNIYIGPNKAFDTNKYFVISVDAIGGGNSSSPLSTGLGIDFPRYTIRDMVTAQFDLITKGLGIKKLVAVGGPSMGSFQGLEWGINYPDTMSGLVLIVPAPRAENTFKMIVDAMNKCIELDPSWNGGKYTQNPVQGLRCAGMVFTPWLSSDIITSMQRTPEEYNKLLSAMGGNFAGWDANSWMWRYFASREHDIAKPFGGNLNAALAKIKAKSILLPSVTDRTLPPEGARELYRGLKDATYAEIPSIRGHGANNPGSESAGEYIFISEQLKKFFDSL
jgi:homoserine O-acetyltransferase